MKNLNYMTFFANGMISFVAALVLLAVLIVILGVKLATCDPLVLCGSVCVITCVLWRASFFMV